MKSLVICQYCGEQEGSGRLPATIGQYNCFQCVNRLAILSQWTGERYREEHAKAMYQARVHHLAQRLAA